MSPLLLSALALIFLYGIYFSTRAARLTAAPAAFLDGGGALPGWAAMFLLPGLVFAGLGVSRHLELVSRFGLQASHVAVGVVPVAIVALLLWNRMWYVTRVANLATPGDALGQYYQSTALRIIVLGLTVLFAFPFAADILSFVASLLESATSGLVPRAAGVWILATGSAFAAIIGGWRGTIISLAMLSVMILLFFPVVTLIVELTAAAPGYPGALETTTEAAQWGRLPGVIQKVFGIGKSIPANGIFTAVGVSSAILALSGVVINPPALYLAQTTAQGRTLGVSAIWLTGGLLAGILIFCAPILAYRIGGGPVALAEQLYLLDPLLAVLFVLLLLAGAILAFNFFVVGSVMLIIREGILSYLLPNLPPEQQRLTARITLGLSFFLIAFMAGFLPVISAIGASVALPLSVQLLPALIGMTFLRWIGPGAVLAGIAIGGLIVVFTEPLGIILFEALFVELPWGRWPLTIHSAAWGLVFNFAVVLLASGATLKSEDRFDRARLHDAVATAATLTPRGLGPLGALFLIWSFLAYGPGAVLGNTFFSDPIFTQIMPTLEIPSLWVWQILFWLSGVPLIWLVAHFSGFGQMTDAQIKPIVLGPPRALKAPGWLAASLARLS